jgi:hypothetical protein
VAVAAVEPEVAEAEVAEAEAEAEVAEAEVAEVEAEAEVVVVVVEEEEEEVRSDSCAAGSPRTAPTRCLRRTSRASRRPRLCRTGR